MHSCTDCENWRLIFRLHSARRALQIANPKYASGNYSLWGFAPGRVCSLSCVQGDRRGRFAKPTCPVCARRFSRLFSNLPCSQLHWDGLICRLKCTKSAPRKRHPHTSSNGTSGPEQLPVSSSSDRNTTERREPLTAAQSEGTLARDKAEEYAYGNLRPFTSTLIKGENGICP
jgi:hypothetical protein